MSQDVKDWKEKLTTDEKHFLTNLFRFFVQGDIDVSDGYVNNYIPHFPQPEVRMMLLGFAAREAIHVAAYAHLIETIGLPETTYNEFMDYTVMRDKHDFVFSFDGTDKRSIAKNIAVFSAFTEGMQLFSSFIMLLNFIRHGKMKGMGQIITWSVADETCVDNQTEILTPEGWKLFGDLEENITKVAQFDSITNKIDFVIPSKIIRKSYRGDMISYTSKKSPIDIMVTPDHDMIVKNLDTYKIQKIQARDTKKHPRWAIPVAGKVAGAGVTKDLSIQERFLIALQADGSLSDPVIRDGSRSGCYSCSFSLTKPRKIQRLTYLLNKLGYEYTTTPRAAAIIFLVKVPVSVPFAKKFVDWAPKFDDMSYEWTTQFIDEVVQWRDGWTMKKSDSVGYGSTDFENAQFVQTVASLSGYRVNVMKSIDNRKDTYKDYYRLHMIPNHIWNRLGLVDKSTVPYDGEVFCVTVPTGAILTRRNGNIAVVGNCHTDAMISLFRTFIQENPELWDDELKGEIYAIAEKMVELEDAFIELAFQMGPMENLTAEEVKKYIRYIADRRLIALGMKGIFKVRKNPLPWVEGLLGVSHVNFFEQKSTDYSKGATTGSWDSVWA